MSENYNQARLRHVNRHAFREAGDYVLYWMQMARRLDHNHALNYALALAGKTRKPLVVYEGLKLGYPWASRRLHRFVLEGMADNRTTARELGLNYWPFVETPTKSGRGLLTKLAERAVAVVTDDYPCFIVPDQTEALARKTEAAVVAIDANGIVPISLLGPVVSAAAHLRPRLHKEFAEAWKHRAGPRRTIPDCARIRVEPTFDLWQATDLDAFLNDLPLDRSVVELPSRRGGTRAGRQGLHDFLARRFTGYAERRSQPVPPDASPASGLSPYLHFGHLAIEEVVEAVLCYPGKWSVESLRTEYRGKREGFFSEDADVNSFLDEAITWRDLGFHWHWTRRRDTESLEKALPSWAWRTLCEHASDARSHDYSLEQWEAGQTHDPLWNAAQRELVATGTIHNYLRMLWGKKVLEWSRTPEEAYRVLVHLNNKYALDGRDPNSYTGILWCFGLFDRPWPERKVYGTIRYMSSENTAKKFKLGAYLAYVEGLSNLADAQAPSDS